MCKVVYDPSKDSAPERLFRKDIFQMTIRREELRQINTEEQGCGAVSFWRRKEVTGGPMMQKCTL
jgi:hypothetical protein